MGGKRKIPDVHIGDKFNEWTVISEPFYEYPKKSTVGRWKVSCRCSCGNEYTVKVSTLLNNRSSRCRNCANSAKRDIPEIGTRFHRLTVIGIGEPYGRHTTAICQCDCGNIVKCLHNHLKRGVTKSCGCYQKETISKRNTKHGYSKHPAYNNYAHMMDRCYNPDNVWYKEYGGRGITVCDEWRNNPKAFCDWADISGFKVEKLPSGRNKWSLDRIDPNGNYCPDNCRWADNKTQVLNRKVVHKVFCFETNCTYESAAAAGVATNVSKPSVLDVCHGKRDSAKGYHFKFVDND